MVNDAEHRGSEGAPAHELPYFDEIFARQQADDPSFKEAFARNVHFGYWPQPGLAAGNLADYAAATEELSRQIFRVAAVADGQALIDIGCGFGGTVAKLDAEFSRMQLVGLNIDPRQIEAARKLCPSARAGNAIRFVVADAAATGEGTASFDCALAIEVIFHFPSREAFFREMARILKPGGVLLVTEIVLNPMRLPLVLPKALLNLPQLIRYKESIGDLGDPVTVRNYRTMAAQHGFTLETIEDWSAHIRPSFECLKHLNAQGVDGKQSLYAPKLLDFAAYLIERQAQRYLAFRLRRDR